MFLGFVGLGSVGSRKMFEAVKLNGTNEMNVTTERHRRLWEGPLALKAEIERMGNLVIPPWHEFGQLKVG